MAILRRVMIIVGAILALVGCSALPEVPQPETIRHGIGWIKRQFLTCENSSCPQPTQKTLAVVEFPSTPPSRSVPPKVEPNPPSKEVTSEEVVEWTIRFEFGKALPTVAGLKTILEILPLAIKATRIELIGRTDDVGQKAYNDRLARKRAEHVRDWLVMQGIHAPIEVRAEGMCCYLDSSHTEVARRYNRRVEVRLVHLVTRRDAVSNSKGVQ